MYNIVANNLKKIGDVESDKRPNNFIKNENVSDR